MQKLNKIKPKILCETNIISISSDSLTKWNWWSGIQGSYRVLNSWKSLEICPAINFSDLEQVWRIDRKSGKMVKSLKFVFRAITRASWFSFFVLVKSYSISPVSLLCIERKALFLFLRSELIIYLTASSLEKEIIVLKKSLEIVLNFGFKICMNPENQTF